MPYLLRPELPGDVVGLERELFGQPIGPLAAIGVKRALDPLQDPRLVGDQELTTDVDLNAGSCELLAEPVIEFRSRTELGGEVAGQLVDERLYRRWEEDPGPPAVPVTIPARGRISGLLRRVLACRLGLGLWLRALALTGE